MLASFLKNRDAFGHQVKLKVKNGNADEQTSAFGGTLTLFIYCFVSSFFLLKSIKMYGKSLDNITSNEEVTQAHEIQKVNFTGMMPVLQFWT